MLKRIHVNQHVIKRNAKYLKAIQADPKEPGVILAAPLTVKTYKQNVRGYEVEICGPCRLVYRPQKPLSCGATVWIETESEVFVDEAIANTHGLIGIIV